MTKTEYELRDACNTYRLDAQFWRGVSVILFILLVIAGVIAAINSPHAPKFGRLLPRAEMHAAESR